MTTKDTLAIYISSVAVIISIFTAIRNWKYNELSIRYSIRHHYMSILSDIDKLLIANPTLWAIYDSHPLAATKSVSAEDTAKREAFIYLIFNLLESLFDCYHNGLRMHKSDKEFWASWEMYARQLFANSSEAKGLFLQARTQQIFRKDYTDFMNGLIEGN